MLLQSGRHKPEISQLIKKLMIFLPTLIQCDQNSDMGIACG